MLATTNQTPFMIMKFRTWRRYFESITIVKVCCTITYYTSDGGLWGFCLFIYEDYIKEVMVVYEIVLWISSPRVIYFTLGDGPLETLESFTITDKTHKPELRIILCNYVNVLLCGPYHILSWISSAYPSKWNQDLKECNMYMRRLVKKSYWRLIGFNYIRILKI